MINEVITLNEVANDGNFVHLYFNEEVGFYMAYGLSAYLVCRVVDPVCSYSEKMQMPVALLTKQKVEVCRMSLNKLQHQRHQYYKFQTATTMPLGKDYMEWVAKLKKKCL